MPILDSNVKGLKVRQDSKGIIYLTHDSKNYRHFLDSLQLSPDGTFTILLLPNKEGSSYSHRPVVKSHGKTEDVQHG